MTNNPDSITLTITDTRLDAPIVATVPRRYADNLRTDGFSHTFQLMLNEYLHQLEQRKQP